MIGNSFDIDGTLEYLFYHGTHLGPLNSNRHNIHGHVFLVNETNLLIKGFTYDGKCPETRFKYGTSYNLESEHFPLVVYENSE